MITFGSESTKRSWRSAMLLENDRPSESMPSIELSVRPCTPKAQLSLGLMPYASKRGHLHPPGRFRLIT